MTQRELAKMADNGSQTLSDFERSARTPHPNNILALRVSLEEAGVEFIEENGGGPGVRLRG